MNISDIIMGDNVHIFKEYVVNWGSLNHLKAILFLSKKALEDTKNSYFHLITGQDFPVKARDYFYNELDTEKNYLEYFEMPAKGWMDRIEYYNFYELFDYKKKLATKLLKHLQQYRKN